MPQKPPPRPTVQRPRGTLARVVVELDLALALPYRDRTGRQFADAGVGKPAEWDDLERDFPGVAGMRVFRDPRVRIDELERRANLGRSSYRIGTLPRYYAFEVPRGSRPAEELARRLRVLHRVTRAWVEDVGPPPYVLLPANPRCKLSDASPGQGYLRKAPAGIDAEHAWAHVGGDGDGTSLIDVEEGWTLDHEDLVAKRSNLVHGVNSDESCGHGTSVLGVVCGTDANAVGGVGIVPGVNAADVASHIAVSGSPPGGGAPAILATNIADAVTVAASLLGKGQVLLLEAQIYGPDGMLCPPELNADIRAAISLAVALDVVVVETGGNGDESANGVDLDTYTDDDGKTVLARGSPDFEDSGAILVSAADSVSRVRHPWAPFGKRIDCWAWGDGIDTANSVATRNGRLKDIYRQDFGGTSGAGAIVAGAVLAIQGVARAWTGSRLAPGTVRDHLRKSGAGTPASAPAAPAPPGSEPIGRMPDLRALLDVELEYPRILVRDFELDTGAPHTGSFNSSPDILVTPAPSAGAGDPATGTEVGSPEADAPDEDSDTDAAASVPRVLTGRSQEIRVVLRNLGATDANNVKVDVYAFDPANALDSTLWTLVGGATVAAVPTGGAPVTSPPILWSGGSLLGVGPRWLAAAVGTTHTPPVVPANFVKLSNFSHLVRSTGIFAVRSVAVVGLQIHPRLPG